MPVLVVLLLVAISAGATFLITRHMLTPQFEEAQQEASVAKSQVSTLTQELAKKDEQLKESTKTTSSTSKKDDSSSSSKDKKDEAQDTTSTGVESPWTQSGTFSSGDGVLDSEVKAFCDARASSSTPRDNAAMEVYKGIAWSEYVERDDAQKPSGKDWRIEYARKYYEHDCTGNCYEFAAFLSYCLQYMGYDDAKAEAVVVELASGDWGDHGLVFLTSPDGGSCLIDTSRGTNGWMLPQSSYNYQVKDFESA